ncbi:hypothetical protein C0J52_17559 [Blattella germanica]|nr:hypothetical protein C0J52_17559 [Blattella germanica]
MDFLGLRVNAVRTRSTVSSFILFLECLPVCGIKVPVALRVLSHCKIDFDVGGSTLNSKRNRRRTRVTDFNSASQSTHFTFCCGVHIVHNTTKNAKIQFNFCIVVTNDTKDKILERFFMQCCKYNNKISLSY